jgi:glycogen(starch) synthase
VSARGDGRRLAVPPHAERAGAIGLLQQMRLMRQAHRRRWCSDDRPDLIHAHSPVLNACRPLGGPSLRLPVVYEMRAFWEDAAVDHGSTTEGSLRYRCRGAGELRPAPRRQVTTICEGLRGDIVARGIDAAERITVIPNAVDVGSFEASDVPPDPPLRSAWASRAHGAGFRRFVLRL